MVPYVSSVHGPELLPDGNHKDENHSAYEKHRSKNNLSQRTHPSNPSPPLLYLRAPRMIVQIGPFCESGEEPQSVGGQGVTSGHTCRNQRGKASRGPGDRAAAVLRCALGIRGASGGWNWIERVVGEAREIWSARQASLVPSIAREDPDRVRGLLIGSLLHPRALHFVRQLLRLRGRRLPPAARPLVSSFSSTSAGYSDLAEGNRR